jgi:hypothetical protein
MLKSMSGFQTTDIYCRMYSHCYATAARWADIPGPFLGNGLVNTFAQQQTRTQQLYSNTETVFSAACTEMLQARDKVRVSSVWESVKRGLEPRDRGTAIAGAVARKCLVTD